MNQKQRKAELLQEANRLAKEKQRLYGNIDISAPMSIEEKELNAKIANIYSEINQIVMANRALN